MHEEPDESSSVRLALDRYEQVFGELPPLIAWHGRDEHLIVLTEAAIKAGKALSEDDLIIAQGGKAQGGKQVSLADVLNRYREAFGDPAPLVFWGGPDERLIAILEEAIRTGKKVTPDDLLRAQGGTKPAPDDAIY